MLWSIRAALLLFAVVLWLRITHRHRGTARVFWSIGCALFLVHVGLAFHLVHHWSHAEAYRETGRRTAELFGTSSGAGLYFNYLFMVTWIADVCWWWIAGLAAYDRRPRWVDVLVYGFMAFIAVNATVVFEKGATRWAGVGVTVLLVWAWAVRRFGNAMSDDKHAFTNFK